MRGALFDQIRLNLDDVCEQLEPRVRVLRVDFLECSAGVGYHVFDAGALQLVELVHLQRVLFCRALEGGLT